MSHTPVTQGQHSITKLLTLFVTLGLAEALIAPRLQMLVSHTPVTQGQRSITELRMLLIALELAEGAQGHLDSSRWCTLAPGSPEGAGWLQAPPEGAGWPYSPQMVQAGVSRCPGAPGVFGAVFR